MQASGVLRSRTLLNSPEDWAVSKWPSPGLSETWTLSLTRLAMPLLEMSLTVGRRQAHCFPAWLRALAGFIDAYCDAGTEGWL